MSKTLHIKADDSNVKLDVDLIYPVGSIYMSVNSTSPATLFGGTWEQIKDTFLLGSGSYTLGATGGEKEHTLVESELPTIQPNFYKTGGSSGRFSVSYEWSNSMEETATRNSVIGSFGGGKSHNNMPPYLVVNIWKRTA